MTAMQILSIDAWRSADGGWDWNNWHKVGEYSGTLDNNRAILKTLREMGLLSEYSKGRVTVDDDQYNLVIIDKNTREPIFAIEYGPHI